jgi:hypothetical protein
VDTPEKEYQNFNLINGTRPAVACKYIKAVLSVTVIIELGTGSTMYEKPCGNSDHIGFLIRPRYTLKFHAFIKGTGSFIRTRRIRTQ